MGTFRYSIELGSLDQSRFQPLEALVDTGATYTWIPRPFLEELGIQPLFKRRLKLADGRLIEREAAQAPIRIDGQVLLTVCVFGDPGTEPLLGAVTLEEFSLGADPLNQRLVPVVSLLM